MSTHGVPLTDQMKAELAADLEAHEAAKAEVIRLATAASKTAASEQRAERDTVRWLVLASSDEGADDTVEVMLQLDADRGETKRLTITVDRMIAADAELLDAEIDRQLDAFRACDRGPLNGARTHLAAGHHQERDERTRSRDRTD